MNNKTRLLLLAALFVLALPLMFTGIASAKYQSDGATQNGTTGGWNAPTDGICVLSIDASGNMITDPSITTSRDCQARLVSVTAVTSNDTLAHVCGTPSLNTAGVKYAAPGSSTCVTVDGSGYINGSKSMINVDRNAQMCTGLGGVLANNAAVKTTANGTAAECIAYGWQYRGQDASGTPLTMGATGMASGPAGFCSAFMTTTLSAASCPSTSSNSTTAFGYIVNGTHCDYQFGITGNVDQNNTSHSSTPSWSSYKNLISGATVAPGTPEDLTGYTQGQCLVAGFTWNSWVALPTTGVLNGITSAAIFDLTRQAAIADEGCLHCHSTKVQTNGDVYRQKDSYLLTGHKNMLRKVTPGLAWGGPNAIGVLTPYTTDGTNAMTWGTLGVAGSALDGTHPMYYVYGDWMALNPTVAIAGSNYSCANCHSTGFGNGTTAQTPIITGVQSIGTPGYAGTQPADAGASYVSAVKAGWEWDLEGIQCGRCHNATVPTVTAAQIAASSFPSTAPTAGGMGALAAGTGINNLCFGCHQSIGKTWPAGTAQYDPTIIPVGVSHGAQAGREFNGHVLGNSFLNSVHARYAGAQSGNGSITLNSLGENDLTDPNGTVEYNSIFQGYTCYQGSTGVDVALTDASGNPLTPATCNTIYGAGSWRVDTNGTQGTCTTCHDVHNSLFVATQKDAAIKKTCEDCHENNATTGATVAAAPQVDMSVIRHLKSPGTPFDTSKYESACVACHMATQAEANGDQTSMPAHLWRINTLATYSTFPSVGQFYGGSCSVHSGAVQNAPTNPVVYLSDTTSAACTAASGTWTAVAETRNANVYPETVTTGAGGTYANAVWVDLDLACGQCHGGSLGSGATHNGAPYLTKPQLSTAATGIHSGGSVAGSANFFWLPDAVTSYKVNFDGSMSVCPSGSTCSYTWNFGDTTAGAGTTTTHTYSGAGSFSVTLTVANITGPSFSASTTQTVAPTVVNAAPTVNRTGFNVVNMTASFTDASSDTAVAAACTNYYGNPCTSGASAPTVTVSWGDGAVVTQSLGTSFTHTYLSNASFVITQIVKGATGLEGRYKDVSALATSSGDTRVVVPTSTTKYSISGTITSASLPVAGATVVLKLNGETTMVTITASDGTYSFAGLAGSTTYTVTASMFGYDWSTATGTQSLSLPVTVPVAAANVTGVNFTPATSPATL